MTWRKSTYSSASGGSCVEVGQAQAVMVRDTKQGHMGEARTVLSFTPEAWRVFTAKIG